MFDFKLFQPMRIVGECVIRGECSSDDPVRVLKGSLTVRQSMITEACYNENVDVKARTRMWTFLFRHGYLGNASA